MIQNMIDPAFAAEYNFELKEHDLVSIFGENNYQVLTAPKIIMAQTGTMTEEGVVVYYIKDE